MNDGANTDNELGFYDSEKPNYYLTNFYGANDTRDPVITPNFRKDGGGNSYLIEIGGQHWVSTEQYFQASKFTPDSDVWKEIKNAPSPSAAFDIAQKNQSEARPDWEKAQQNGLIVKEEIMLKALCAKFSQNPDLMKALLSTGNSYIAEHSPVDDYWGSLQKDMGPGQNRLGIMLTELREAAKLHAQQEQKLMGQDFEDFLFKNTASTIANYPPYQDRTTARTSEPQYKSDYMEAHPELVAASELGNDEKKKKKKFEAKSNGSKDDQDFGLPNWMVQAGWSKQGSDYFRKDDSGPAFSIENNEIILNAEKIENIVDMVRLLRSHEVGLVIAAPPNDVEAAMVYLEAKRQGVSVEGFTPTEAAVQQAQANLADIQAKTPHLAGAANEQQLSGQDAPPDVPSPLKPPVSKVTQPDAATSPKPLVDADENVVPHQKEDNLPPHDVEHVGPPINNLENFLPEASASDYQRNDGGVFTKGGVPAFSHDGNRLTFHSQDPSVVKVAMQALKTAGVTGVTLTNADAVKWKEGVKVDLNVDGFEPKETDIDSLCNEMVIDKGKTLRGKNGPATMTKGANVKHHLKDDDVVKSAIALFVDKSGSAYVLETVDPAEQRQKGEVKCIKPDQQLAMRIGPIKRGDKAPEMKIGQPLNITPPSTPTAPVPTPSLGRRG